MDLIRTIVSGIIMMMFHSVNVAPNTVNKNDMEKMAGNSYNSNFYLLAMSQYAFLFTYILTNLYNYSDQALSTYEWTMFLIFVSGWILRFASYFTLGEFFMFKVGVKKNHRLIKSGPYKYLVHPSYTGGLILTVALFMYSGFYFWLSLIIIGISLNVCYKRCIMEENVMREKFGKEYDEYISGRWRMIPFVV